MFLNSPHVIKASVVKLHHRYDPKGAKVHDNDIALVKLVQPIKFERALQSICLPMISNNNWQYELIRNIFFGVYIYFPSIGYDYGGLTASVAGWGQVSEISFTSLKLRYTTLPLWATKECTQVPDFEKMGYTDNMLCAGLKDGGKDSCQVKQIIIHSL